MFERRNISFQNITEARKEKIGRDAAWEKIRISDRVYIGQGKKTLQFKPTAENRDEILAAALGRTGSLRAPVIQAGHAMFIGFNDTLYDADSAG